jgi:hypothetical protein
MGDLNRDGAIGRADAVLLAQRFGASAGGNSTTGSPAAPAAIIAAALRGRDEPVADGMALGVAERRPTAVAMRQRRATGQPLAEAPSSTALPTGVVDSHFAGSAADGSTSTRTLRVRRAALRTAANGRSGDVL